MAQQGIGLGSSNSGRGLLGCLGFKAPYCLQAGSVRPPRGRPPRMTSLIQTSYPTSRQHLSDCVTTQPWTPLSSSTAPRGLPTSLAPFSASSVVSLSSYASMISGASAALSAACTLGLECRTCLARGKDAAPVWQSSGSRVRHACGIAGQTAAAALPAILSNFGPGRRRRRVH